RVGKDGLKIRAVGRQFDLVQRRQDLLVLVTKTVGDVHIQGGASAGSRRRTAGAVRSASASGHDQQGERCEEKCARSSETLHTTYILSFWLRPACCCHNVCFMVFLLASWVVSPGGTSSP